MGTPSKGGWVPCPEGELRKLSARLTAYRQRRRAFGVLVGATLTVAAGGVSVAAVEYLPGWLGFGNASLCPPQPVANTPAPP